MRREENEIEVQKVEYLVIRYHDELKYFGKPFANLYKLGDLYHSTNSVNSEIEEVYDTEEDAVKNFNWRNTMVRKEYGCGIEFFDIQEYVIVKIDENGDGELITVAPLDEMSKDIIEEYSLLNGVDE